MSKKEMTDAVIELQKLLTEIEVDAIIDLDAETKAMLSELPEQTRTAVKNLVYRSRVMGELSGLQVVYDGAISLISKAMATNSRGPAETCSDILDFVKFQESRVIHAVKAQNRVDEMVDFLSKKPAYTKEHPLFKECLGLKDVMMAATKDNSATVSNVKETSFTNDDVDISELMKKAVPGSNAMN